MHIFFRK